MKQFKSAVLWITLAALALRIAHALLPGPPPHPLLIECKAKGTGMVCVIVPAR